MTGPNTALAYEVLDLALAHPKNFYMGTWARGAYRISFKDLTGPPCGTTACLAGWTVAHRGYQLDPSGAVYRDGMYVGQAATIARALLGISEYDSCELFDCPDQDIQVEVRRIFGPRPGVPA